MGFWIFMFVFDVLIPLTMIGLGMYFVRSGGPKEINWLMGYRTNRSMKNEETWRFAHRHCGRLWKIYGWIMLVCSAVIMLFFIGKDKDTVGAVGGTLSIVQIAVLLVPIFLTERALKKHFDADGNPK